MRLLKKAQPEHVLASHLIPGITVGELKASLEPFDDNAPVGIEMPWAPFSENPGGTAVFPVGNVGTAWSYSGTARVEEALICRVKP